MVFDKDIQKLMEDEKANNRMFTKTQKDVCWNNSTMIPSRDPSRWRLDAVGNPVLYILRGCHGTLCHEYDHIVPFSKGGTTTVANCQILQTAVNRYKSNKVNLSMEELRKGTKVHRLNQRDMDLIEYAVYGEVHRYDFETKVVTKQIHNFGK